MDSTNEQSRLRLISAGLALMTFVAFWPALRNDFIWFDDGPYVTRNPHVMDGLTWGNILWAFTSGYASNWHPVTWLSHMLDAQFFGNNPAGHHLTSVLLHTANTVILFLLLQRWTGGVWRSAIVATLFAVHPLHVESVAWVAERKDVLSTFFFLLSLGAYVSYAKRTPVADTDLTPTNKDTSNPARQSARKWYLLSLLLFAFSLMSKPMAVTLPFLLLLLDHWPLQRRPCTKGPLPFRSSVTTLVEKLPFFLLSIVVSLVTFLVQQKGHALSMALPFSSRLANAVASYAKYLFKTVWPADLAVFYPHPDTLYPVSHQWPVTALLTAGVALVAITAAAWIFRHGRPWLLTGWFWYIITLGPVIGLIQAGTQSMADRYSYIPLIGIFIGVVWSVAELAGSAAARHLLQVGTAAVLLACLAVTHRQVLYWRNTLTLFQHALAVTSDNAPAHFKVGSILGGEGDFEAAINHFRAAIRADPNYLSAYDSLGMALEGMGRVDEAIEQYRAALRIAPWWDVTHNRLGMALWATGKREEACREYEEALRINPESADAHFNLGLSLLQLGKPGPAANHLREAVRLMPNDPDALTALGRALAAGGKPREGIAVIQKVLVVKPEWPGALRSLAWLLATSPDAELRNGPEAVRLAERACQLSDGKDPRFWASLDVAYAEVGDFSKAIATGEKTRQTALDSAQPDLADAAESRLVLYRRQQAFHETAKASSPSDEG